MVTTTSSSATRSSISNSSTSPPISGGLGAGKELIVSAFFGNELFRQQAFKSSMFHKPQGFGHQGLFGGRNIGRVTNDFYNFVNVALGQQQSLDNVSAG